MRDERYSIEVADDSIVIYGDLSIEETFDYLNFFEKKGFKSICTGIENSTLFMRRKSIEQVEDDTRKVEHEESEKFHEMLHEAEKKSHERSKNKINQLEHLVKSIISDKSERLKAVEEQNKVLLRAVQLHKLESNETIQKLLACDPPGTEVPFPFDWTYPKQKPIPEQELP